MSKREIDTWIINNYDELITIFAGMAAKKNLVLYSKDLFSNA